MYHLISISRPAARKRGLPCLVHSTQLLSDEWCACPYRVVTVLDPREGISTRLSGAPSHFADGRARSARLLCSTQFRGARLSHFAVGRARSARLLCSTRFRGAPSHFAGPGAQRAACVAGGCPYLVATLVNGQVWSFAKKPRASREARPSLSFCPLPFCCHLFTLCSVTCRSVGTSLFSVRQKEPAGEHLDGAR